MTKIIAALTSALAFVFGSRETIKALKQQVADRDKTIADLLAAHAADDADDASLEAAAVAAREAQAKAEAELKAITDANAEAEAKADELAQALSADPEVPIIVSQDGTVTPQEPAA